MDGEVKDHLLISPWEVVTGESRPCWGQGEALALLLSIYAEGAWFYHHQLKVLRWLVM